MSELYPIFEEEEWAVLVLLVVMAVLNIFVPWLITAILTFLFFSVLIGVTMMAVQSRKSRIQGREERLRKKLSGEED